MSIEKSERRVVHYKFGEPQDVLSLEHSPPVPPLASGKVRVRMTRSMIHPADMQLVAAKYSQSRDDIPEGRVPGMEGVGIVEEAAPGVLDGTGIPIGTRVAFLGDGTWQRSIDLPPSSLVSIPDDISDDVATQLLLNTITARIVLRTAERTIGGRPSRIVLTAASSAVGKIISVLALRDGVPLIRIVRSTDSAARLSELLPGGSIISTETTGWQKAVRGIAGDDIPLIVDGVGGPMISESGWLLNVGGALISFGLLDGSAADLTMFVPKQLTLRGISMGNWAAVTDPEEQARDLNTAFEIARLAPQLFEGSTVFDLSDLSTAIAAATSPAKQASVLFSI
jgi:NADPH2:quinone reductase